MRASGRRWGRQPRRRRGVVLVLCLFVIAATAVILVGILQTQRIRLDTIRHTANYERAQQLAAAGVHHALANLQADPNWRGQIGATELPLGSGYTYSATAASAQGNRVEITGQGTAGNATRRMRVVVQPNP